MQLILIKHKEEQLLLREIEAVSFSLFFRQRGRNVAMCFTLAKALAALRAFPLCAYVAN